MSTLTAAQLGLGGRPPTLLIDGAFVLFAESLAQLPASHPAYRHEDERGNNHHCDDNANNVGRIHDWPPFRPTYSPWSRALHRRAFSGVPCQSTGGRRKNVRTARHQAIRGDTKGYASPRRLDA